MSPTTVLDYADEYRRALMALEKSRVQRYISAYTPIYKDLSMQISALTAELAMMDDPKVWKVNKLQRLTDLKKQVAAELNDFGTFVDRDIRADVKKFVKMGLDHSEALVYAGMPKELASVIASQWNRLPVEAVQTAMGFFESGSPLHAKLNETLGPHIANLIGDKVTKGIATGMNPQTIGRLLNTTLGVGLNSAMNTARTSMLYAYREASRANYLANSDIVDQWIWGAHLHDERTCMACIMMHGTKHPLTQPLNDHFMGRCTMIPFTKSWEELGIPGIADTRPQVESGEDWFNKLPEAEQRRRMGGKAYEAWKEGKITLKDLVTTHDNDVYGSMIGVRSLSGKAPGGPSSSPVAPPAPPAPPKTWDDFDFGNPSNRTVAIDILTDAGISPDQLDRITSLPGMETSRIIVSGYNGSSMVGIKTKWFDPNEIDGDSGNRLVGSMERSLRRDRNGSIVTVENDLLEISQPYQGMKLADHLYSNQFSVWRELGVRDVEVYADISIGKYAWAKRGFDFKQQSDLTRANRLFYLFLEDMGIDPSGLVIPDFRSALDIANFDIPGLTISSSKLNNREVKPGEYRLGAAYFLARTGIGSWEGVFHLR